MTLTKEEQIQAIYDLKVGYKLGYADIAMLKSMARQFLAALGPRADAEPVAWLNDAYLARGVVDGEAGSEDAGPGYIPVYREPLYTRPQPAPVVPDAYVRDERGRMMLNGVCESRIGFGFGWNACRAAMLQGKAEPVSQPYTLPDGYALVPVEPTPEMLTASYMFAHVENTADSWKAMLAAAPQQDAK